MKAFARVFAVGLMTVALATFVACGDDDTPTPQPDSVETPDDGDTDTTEPGDDVKPDEDVEPREDTDPGEEPEPDTKEDADTEDDTDTDADTEEPPECVKDCEGRTCGVDPVCGESCGTCDTENGEICVELIGQCLEAKDWETDKPTTWGKAGLLDSLLAPGAGDSPTVCFDYTGDGVGDNGLADLAGLINGNIKNPDEFGIIFDFEAVEDFKNSGEFVLVGLMGEPDTSEGAEAGDYLIKEDSYIKEAALPLIAFKDSEIVNEELTTPKSRFTLSIPISDTVVIDATLTDAQIKGTIVEADDKGVKLEGGVLSGILTKRDLETAIDKLDANCKAQEEAGLEKGKECGFLGTARSVMTGLFNLHKKADGTYVPKNTDEGIEGNCVSACLNFTLGKIVIKGFVPEEPAAE